MGKLFTLVAIVLRRARGSRHRLLRAAWRLSGSARHRRRISLPGRRGSCRCASCSTAGHRWRTRRRRSGFGGRTASSWSSRRRRRRRSARTGHGSPVPRAGRYSLSVYDGFPVKECAQGAHVQRGRDSRSVLIPAGAAAPHTAVRGDAALDGGAWWIRCGTYRRSSSPPNRRCRERRRVKVGDREIEATEIVSFRVRVLMGFLSVWTVCLLVHRCDSGPRRRFGEFPSARGARGRGCSGRARCERDRCPLDPLDPPNSA